MPLHSASFYTEKLLRKKLFHTEACTHRRFYPEKLLHTKPWGTMVPKIAADLGTKAKKCDPEAPKIISAKSEKMCSQITIASLMQPLLYDLRCPAAKDAGMEEGATPSRG